MQTLIIFFAVLSRMAGIEPFAFEPEYTEDEMAEHGVVITQNEGHRDNNGVDKWCHCRHCKAMQTPVECLCCHTSDLTASALNMRKLRCITEDPQMQSVVLNGDVLTIMYIQMMFDTGKNGRAPDILDDKYVRLVQLPSKDFLGLTFVMSALSICMCDILWTVQRFVATVTKFGHQMMLFPLRK